VARFVQGVDLESNGDDGILKGNAETIKLNRLFDIVTAGDVIEHLHNPGLFLKNMNKHLKLNGYIIIVTPNVKSIGYLPFKGNDYHTCWYCKKTLKYLDKRHVKHGSIINWELGLSPESWDGLLKYLVTEGYKEDDIFTAGLIVKKKDGSGYVDRFRKRLMFPLFDTQGRVVAFTSRSLSGIVYDEEEFGGKYVNSPQTPVYDKSKMLYGWHFAKDTIRQKKYLIVVEGNMDVVAAHQTSAKNTVAVSGTALTAEHIKLIKRYANNVILAFDGDAAGSRASFRSIALCWKEDMNVKILVLPKGKDPADIIKSNPDEWLQFIKDSIPVMDYYFKRIF